MVRSLTNDDVEQVLDMATTVELMEQTFEARGEGRAVNIPRSDAILPLGPDAAYVLKVHPGLVADFDVAAVRIQSDYIEWTETRKVKRPKARGQNHVQYVTVFDTETTEPVLVYQDGFVSKMRVGATNAVAAKHLAPPGGSTLGLLGAGRQATGQVWGFATVLDLDRITVYSPTEANREAFARDWDDRLDAEVVAVDSAREAVRGVDVFACASNAMRPIFEADWIEPGMHVSAIKNPEVPDEALHRADRVVVTTKTTPSGPNNYAPAGSGFADRLTDAHSVGYDVDAATTLAELVVDGPDRDPDETTFFLNNLGVGMQFAAVGRYLADTADEAGLGVEFDTERFLQPMW